MTFRDKIDKVVEASGKSIRRIEQECGFSLTTLQKAYNENRGLSQRLSAEFQHRLRINPTWWESGKGEIFLSDEENLTPVSKLETAKNERAMDLLESSLKYAWKLIDKLEAELAVEKNKK